MSAAVNTANGPMPRRAVGLATLVLSVAWIAGPGAVSPGWSADAPSVPTLSISAAVAQALRENSGLLSLRARVSAMQERPAQADALGDPMFRYSGMDAANGGSFPDTGEKRYMLEQPFQGFGKRGLERAIAVKDAEVAQQELDTAKLDLVLLVKETVHELSAVRQAVTIAEDEMGVLERLADVAQTAYTSGARPQTDLLLAQSETTMLKQRLLELRAREAKLTATLNVLRNLPAEAAIGSVDAPTDASVPVDAPAGDADSGDVRPEVQAALALEQRDALVRRLAGRESSPDYRLGLEYRDLPSADGDQLMFTVSLDLPVWRQGYRANVREATHTATASRAAREAAERQVALDAQTARVDLRRARESWDLLRRELIPQAEARFAASEAGYRTGKVDFTDLMESERFLLSARTMSVMAEAEVATERARLERALGGGEFQATARTEEKQP